MSRRHGTSFEHGATDVYQESLRQSGPRLGDASVNQVPREGGIDDGGRLRHGLPAVALIYPGRDVPTGDRQQLAAWTGGDLSSTRHPPQAVLPTKMQAQV